MCACERERENVRECVCVRERVCVCVRERECVCEREKFCERVRVRESMYVAACCWGTFLLA